MTALSLNIQILQMRGPLRSFVRDRSVLAWLVLSLGLGACSSPNIHRVLRADPKILVREWTFETGPKLEAGQHGTEYSNPVIVDNTLVFGNQTTGLIALYPELNQVRWVLPIPNGVVSELSVTEEHIYFGGGDGNLYCVSLDNGRVVWRYQVRNTLISRPTLSGDRVFVTTSDDTVYAFDSKNGQWLWHYKRRTSAPASIHGASAPLADGPEVFVGLSDGYLVSLSSQDGTLRWEKRLHHGKKFMDVDAHPVLDKGVIYVPSYDGALYALDRKSGEVLWRYDAGGSKQVVIEENRIYLPSSDGFIHTLAKENAKVLWKFQLDSGAPTQAIVMDRYVILGSSHQYLYVLDKESGRGLYRFNAGTDNGFSGSPAYDPKSERLYLLSGGGNLYSFLVREPKHKQWEHGSIDGYEFVPQ